MYQYTFLLQFFYPPHSQNTMCTPDCHSAVWELDLLCQQSGNWTCCVSSLGTGLVVSAVLVCARMIIPLGSYQEGSVLPCTRCSRRPTTAEVKGSYHSLLKPTTAEEKGSYHSLLKPTTAEEKGSYHSLLKPTTAEEKGSYHSLLKPTTAEEKGSYHSLLNPTTAEEKSSYHSLLKPTTAEEKGSYHSLLKPTTAEEKGSYHSLLNPTTAEEKSSYHSLLKPTTAEEKSSYHSLLNPTTAEEKSSYHRLLKPPKPSIMVAVITLHHCSHTVSYSSTHQFPRKKTQFINSYIVILKLFTNCYAGSYIITNDYVSRNALECDYM